MTPLGSVPRGAKTSGFSAARNDLASAPCAKARPDGADFHSDLEAVIANDHREVDCDAWNIRYTILQCVLVHRSRLHSCVRVHISRCEEITSLVFTSATIQQSNTGFPAQGGDQRVSLHAVLTTWVHF